MSDSTVLPPAASRLGHWILLAAACNIAGWSLSLVNGLTPVGMVIAIPAFWFLLAKVVGLKRPNPIWPSIVRPWRWRIQKLLPAGCLLVFILAFLGGLIHPPNNLDAMNYRMPRVANWLMAERWEWIAANNNSLNTRSCGFEWLMAPMIGVFRTDRFIFLPNFISFLFLPGLVFGVFRSLGVGGRVAWAWMWLLPTGYCFALQAGSAGNDLPAAVFALAAFDFGFRWKKSGDWSCFSLALVAAGMMTAIKPTTLPLLLPFTILFFGMSRNLFSAPMRTALLCVLAAVASFLPSAAINHYQCGDWTGARAENPTLGSVNPLVGLAGNAINLPIQNLAPPVFPLASLWNSRFIELFPESFKRAMERDFEANGARFVIPDFQAEEWVGIGAGLSWLLIFSAILAFRKGGRVAPSGRPNHWPFYATIFGIALLAYFSRAGMSTVARHISPYYAPFIGIILLAIPQDRVVRSKWWKRVSMLAIASCVVLLIITPARPLWPARWALQKLGKESSSRIIKRALIGYSVYGNRADVLGPLRDALPHEVSTIGFMSYHAGPELPLWKPYMKRRVLHVRPGDKIEDLKDRGMMHVVINVLGFEKKMNISPDQWLIENNGRIIGKYTLQVIAKEPPSEWWVVELGP